MDEQHKLEPIRKRRVHNVQDLKSSLAIVMRHLLRGPQTHENWAEMQKAFDAAAKFAKTQSRESK